MQENDVILAELAAKLERLCRGTVASAHASGQYMPEPARPKELSEQRLAGGQLATHLKLDCVVNGPASVCTMGERKGAVWHF